MVRTWQDNAVGYFISGGALGTSVYEVYHGCKSASALISQSSSTEALGNAQTYAHEILVKGTGGFVLGAIGSAIIAAGVCLATRKRPTLLEKKADEADST